MKINPQNINTVSSFSNRIRINNSTIANPIQYSINEIPKNYSMGYANYFNGMQIIHPALTSIGMPNTELSGIYSGFEEHFFRPNNKLVQPILLTDQQKSIILYKIKNFEYYKASLPKNKLEKLEKSKHSSIHFCVNNAGYPDKSFKNYKNFLNKYEKYKQGNFSDITNEDLSQILFYTSTSDIVSDGKIGPYAQGRVGSCWMLSMLQNFASTPIGEKNIAQRIKGPDINGNYNVIFNNPININEREIYTISEEELNNYDLSDENTCFSSGDIDVRIMEIACEKMLKKHLSNDVISKANSIYEQLSDNRDCITPEALASNSREYDGNIICMGHFEKRLLFQRAMGYNCGMTAYSTKQSIKGYAKEYNIQYNTDKDNTNIYATYINFINNNGKLELIYSIQPTNYQKLSDVLYQNIPSSMLTCDTIDKEYSTDAKERKYISTGHAYNLMGYNSNNNAITVNDPYFSAFPHTIDYSKFNDVFSDIWCYR